MANAHTSTETAVITFGRDAVVAQLPNSMCGNVSLRLDDETRLISGTGTRVQDLSRGQLSTVRTADSAILAGPLIHGGEYASTGLRLAATGRRGDAL